MNEWFQVWDRPEYKEWALPTGYGYLLVILRRQPNDWLVAKAKLIMGDKNLPGFEEIERLVIRDEKEAVSKN